MMEPHTLSREAIEQLYHEYHQPIQRYLEELVSNHETAKDLAHETFIKTLRHCDQLDQATSVRGWLYRIASNTAYDVAWIVFTLAGGAGVLAYLLAWAVIPDEDGRHTILLPLLLLAGIVLPLLLALLWLIRVTVTSTR